MTLPLVAVSAPSIIHGRHTVVCSSCGKLGSRTSDYRATKMAKDHALQVHRGSARVLGALGELKWASA